MSAFDFNEEDIKHLLPKNFDEEVDKAFNRYDADKSGGLDVNELVRVLEDLAKEFQPDAKINVEEAQEAMKDLDLDESKVVEKNEFRKLFIGIYFIRNLGC